MNLNIGDEAKASKRIVLNSSNELIVPYPSITPISDPEPSDILDCTENVGIEEMFRIMTQNIF